MIVPSSTRTLPRPLNGVSRQPCRDLPSKSDCHSPVRVGPAAACGALPVDARSPGSQRPPIAKYSNFAKAGSQQSDFLKADNASVMATTLRSQGTVRAGGDVRHAERRREYITSYRARRLSLQVIGQDLGRARPRTRIRDSDCQDADIPIIRQGDCPGARRHIDSVGIEIGIRVRLVGSV